MRPRNVLTQTNNMRRLMGLPLLKENSGDSIKDIKKKVLSEDRSFSLGFGNQGGLTIGEETESEEFRDAGVGKKDPMEDNVMQEEDIEVSAEDFLFTEDSSYEDIRGEYDRLNTEYDSYDMDAMQGMGDPYKYDVEDRRRFRNLDNERNRISNLYYKMSQEDPMEENLTEDTGFTKYNITLHD